jgi:hypothetical protein
MFIVCNRSTVVATVVLGVCVGYALSSCASIGFTTTVAVAKSQFAGFCSYLA